MCHSIISTIPCTHEIAWQGSGEFLPTSDSIASSSSLFTADVTAFADDGEWEINALLVSQGDWATAVIETEWVHNSKLSSVYK